MDPTAGRADPPPGGSFVRRGLNLLSRPPAALLLLAVLTALAYSNSFSVPFLFDDRRNLLDNPWIKDPSPLLDFSGSRTIGYLTFAMNYHFGGLNVFGYHLVNLLIHIANAFLVFALIRILLRALPSNESDPKADGIALIASLLFALHPIQTQAVTYIVQRFASLAALFYLLSVVCYLKWRLSQRATPHSQLSTPYLWYALALIAAGLAMKTKENTFTLPFMLILVDTVFFPAAGRKRWFALFPFLLTLLIIPFSRLDVSVEDIGITRLTTQIDRWDYLLTQFRVIVSYLRLLVLPIHQNLDYDYPVYHSLLDPPVFLSALFLTALFALSLYLAFSPRLTSYVSPLTSHVLRLTGFGILWFFLTLSVESSLVPIQDVLFEHRLYLPAVGPMMIAAAGFVFFLDRSKGAGRWMWAGTAVLLIVSLAAASYRRNDVWHDESSLWEDVVRKSPGKARGYNNLGIVEEERDLLEKAAAHYRTAIDLKPGYTEAHGNLASVLRKMGRTDEALAEARRALSINPKFPYGYNTLGLIELDRGRITEAADAFLKAIDLKPDFAAGYNNLGLALGKQNLFDEAVRAYHGALERNPGAVEPHLNLALVFAKAGRYPEAIGEWERALELRPDDSKARYNLAEAYRMAGQTEKARREYLRALDLKPDWAPALEGLKKLGPTGK